MGRLCAIVVVSLLFAVSFASRAAAQDESDAPVKEPKSDFNVAPVVGGDSDIGVAVGGLAALTRLAPNREPYLWRIEANVLAAFKVDTGPTVSLPYQDHYFKLTLPYLFGKALRLEIRPSFTHEMVQRYYGIGNASQAPAPGGPEDAGSTYYQYGRMHPTLQVRARLRLGGGSSPCSGIRLRTTKSTYRPTRSSPRTWPAGAPRCERSSGRRGRTASISSNMA